MDLHVRLEGSGDLAEQIYRQLRAAIVEGRLDRGARLPPTRELAQRLAVSRNTVSLAYEWLVADGLVAGRAGAGTFVEGAPAARKGRRLEDVELRTRSAWNSITAPQPAPPQPRFDFGVGMPDARLFPFDTWRRLVARQIRGTRLTSAYGDPSGLPKLREAIARYVGVSRGVSASAEDVVVTSGAQQAFDLLARLLVERGTAVAVEEPGYPPVRLLFRSLGARVRSIAVDDEGLKVDAVPDDVRLLYVTPSHQFPLGMPMSHARRVALLAWAERRNAVIIEDDYDSEFRFGGRPLETLQAMDRSGRVVYVGSFSKSMLPALRLGFMVVPPSLRRPVHAASYVAGWFPPPIMQAALATFIDDGLLARHVRKMRREYSARHDLILGDLTERFGDFLQPVPSVTGMHLAALLRRKSVRLEEQLALQAREAGVGFDRLSNYYSGRPASGLALGYGAVETAKIRAGLDRLLSCFESV